MHIGTVSGHAHFLLFYCMMNMHELTRYDWWLYLSLYRSCSLASPTGSSVNMNIAFETSGSSPAQTSPFSTITDSQPFGFSTSFGLSSQSAFGTTVSVTITSTHAFGATSTRDFGSTSTPPFGLTARPSFGTSAFACGSSSTPSFSFPSIPAVGQSNSTASNPANFGVSSTPSFSFPSTPAFAQSYSY